MYTAMVAIVGGSQGGRCTTAELRDLVVASAEEPDGLEHVHVQALSDRLEIVLFIQASGWREAEVAAHRISLAVIRRLPGWSLVETPGRSPE